MHERLSPREVGIVKHIARFQSGGLRFVTFGADVREASIPLWRRGLVEIWHRQFPYDEPGYRGPQFGLSSSGRRLAAALARASATFEFDRAPRRPSGAMEQQQ
jgi:hypothetical protein